MNIYLPPNGAVEDLINTLEELKPGMTTYKLMLEISTEDKNLAALLKNLTVEDDMNASTVLPRSKPEKKTRKSRKPAEIDLPAETTLPV